MAKDKAQQQDTQLKELQRQLEQTQQQLRSVNAQLNEAKAAQGKQQAATGAAAKPVEGVAGTEAETGRVETTQATQAKPAPEGASASATVRGGIVVNFAPDALEQTPAEVNDMLAKMATFAPVKTSKWRITVEVPKGFSEAKRMGFYRANVVRNALLKNGVEPGNVELKVLESARATADNARVIIRTGP